MTGAKNWIFAFSALFLMMEVGCEEPKALDMEGSFSSVAEPSFVPLPVKLRQRRAVGVSLESDDCHTFQSQDLPMAKILITGAWEKSMVAVQNITQSVSDLKNCFSWNIFQVIPCTIHSAIELFTSYKTYKPQLAQLISDVRTSAGNATLSFFGCAKILVAHNSS